MIISQLELIIIIIIIIINNNNLLLIWRNKLGPPFFFNKNLMVPQLPLVPKVLRFDDP